MFRNSLDFNFKPADFILLISIGLCVLTFTTYWFLAQSQSLKNRFYSKYELEEASLRHIFCVKCIGFFILGMLPLTGALMLIENSDLAYFGLSFPKETAMYTLFSTLVLSGVLISLAFFSARNPKNWVNYPQTRIKIWKQRTLSVYLLGWAIYLFGYELLFRGILLFPLYDHFGLWPAIIINIALYSLSHIPKGLDETIGAIPLGLVLCILSLQTGTIWISFIVHLAMAWTNSLTAIKFNPEMQIKTKKDEI